MVKGSQCHPGRQMAVGGKGIDTPSRRDGGDYQLSAQARVAIGIYERRQRGRLVARLAASAQAGFRLG